MSWQSLAARQRSRYLRFARPPQEQRLIESRTQTMKEANASALVRYTDVLSAQFIVILSLIILLVTLDHTSGSHVDMVISVCVCVCVCV